MNNLADLAARRACKEKGLNHITHTHGLGGCFASGGEVTVLLQRVLTTGAVNYK
jgi:hypothetical protein